MTSSSPTYPVAQPAVLADFVPGARVRDVLLVLGGATFVTVMGQIAVPLPFTPVPLSLATFAVLLTGASLGAGRGAASMGIYLLAGTLGAPLFADGHSGWAFASFGYIVGYVFAGAVVGWLVRRWRVDRSPAKTMLAALLGSAVIYAFGVPWLMAFLGVNVTAALTLGVVPFVIGDVIKAVAAALLLPTAWRILERGAR